VAADPGSVSGRFFCRRARAGGARTAGEDGRTRTAPLWHLELDRTGRAWGFNHRITGIGTGFASDAGFVPRSDVVDAHTFNRASFYGGKGDRVEQLTFVGGARGIWRYRDFASRGPAESALELSADAQLKGGWEVRAEGSRSAFHHPEGAFARFSTGGDPEPRPYVPDDVKGALFLELEVETPAFQAFDAEATIGRGAVPIFAEGSQGRETRVSAAANLRAGKSLRAQALLALSRITRRRDGSEFARVAIPRLKLEYQPRRSLFARAVAEYQAERRDALRDFRTGAPLRVDGAVAGRADGNRLRVDLLVSYEPTPGTVAFLGYGSSLDNGPSFGFDALARQSDGFFLKLAYLFRR
jgi:hypothetical protein